MPNNGANTAKQMETDKVVREYAIRDWQVEHGGGIIVFSKAAVPAEEVLGASNPGPGTGKAGRIKVGAGKK
jgi:hypothetical protein